MGNEALLLRLEYQSLAMSPHQADVDLGVEGEGAAHEETLPTLPQHMEFPLGCNLPRFGEGMTVLPGVITGGRAVFMNSLAMMSTALSRQLSEILFRNMAMCRSRGATNLKMGHLAGSRRGLLLHKVLLHTVLVVGDPVHVQESDGQSLPHLHPLLGECCDRFRHLYPLINGYRLKTHQLVHQVRECPLSPSRHRHMQRVDLLVRPGLVDESPRNVEQIPGLDPSLEGRLPLLHIGLRKVAAALPRQLVLVALGSVDLPILTPLDLEEEGVDVVPMRGKSGTVRGGQISERGNIKGGGRQTYWRRQNSRRPPVGPRTGTRCGRRRLGGW